MWDPGDQDGGRNSYHQHTSAAPQPTAAEGLAESRPHTEPPVILSSASFSESEPYAHPFTILVMSHEKCQLQLHSSTPAGPGTYLYSQSQRPGTPACWEGIRGAGWAALCQGKASTALGEEAVTAAGKEVSSSTAPSTLPLRLVSRAGEPCCTPALP